MLSSISMKLKSTYTQITLNRVTVAFFIFSLTHCFAQGVIQSLLFSVNSEFANLVTQIVQTAEIPLNNITYLEGSPNHWTLHMCYDIPHGQARNPCMVVFQSGVNDIQRTPNLVEQDTIESQSIFQDLSQGFGIIPNRDSLGNVTGVTFQPVAVPSALQATAASSVFLNQQCTQILVYPQQVLQNSVREDITFLFLQIWLLGVSTFALAQSSVPHILTALGTRFLITSWSAYIVIYRTNNQASIFQQMVSAPGTPCGVELFPTYFGLRFAYDVADLVLSCSALMLSGLLSWNLLKVYNAHSFNKRVGAPEHVIRIYKYFMAVQAVLQLEVFVLVAATSLWVAVLTGTGISIISQHTAVYKALIIATTGWYGVRREQKRMMISFLAISFVFVSGWGIMFYSIVYRWSFLQWPYLGCFTVASFILIIAGMILGTICWRNFDLGLREYLNAESALASLNFAPEVFRSQ
ncbi:hypothetical protein B0H16DRAFT_1879104 [Mycena metata]|uniref:Uncharacterized protein n=1 Tax=Mycena metata TaxID=1033252 RepID=A0AAD7K736_9AGAR|nr:hypothetical protein B0H16DRAFT_1879104 [Mycena metata]